MAEIDDIKKEILKPDEKLATFSKHGITEDYLIGKLKAELEAEEEFQRKVGKKEVKIVKKPIWKIRQDARKDAHKLRGDYPAEKHEHTGDVIFHSNVPEPDMPKEEKEEREPSHEEDGPIDYTGYIPPLKQHPEQLEPGIGEFEGKDIEPPEWVKEEHESAGGHTIEEDRPTPDHDQDKEFKNHHRSRRERK